MPSITERMLGAHPQPVTGIDAALLVACLDACRQCTEACTICADACLAEETVADLVTCIRLDLDCADVCSATAAVLSRRAGGVDTGVLRALLEACAAACRACAEECESHASMHDHCAVSAEACRRCASACETLRATLV